MSFLIKLSFVQNSLTASKSLGAEKFGRKSSIIVRITGELLNFENISSLFSIKNFKPNVKPAVPLDKAFHTKETYSSDIRPSKMDFRYLRN